MWPWSEAATDISMSRMAWVVTRPIRSSLPHLLDAVGRPLQLPARQELVEYAACVGQADDHHVAGVRDFVAEEHFHDAELDFALGPAVDGRVAPGTEHPQVVLIVALQDAVFDQSGERLLLDCFGSLRRALQPVPGVVLLARCDLRPASGSSRLSPRGVESIRTSPSRSVSMRSSSARSIRTAPARA